MSDILYYRRGTGQIVKVHYRSEAEMGALLRGEVGNLQDDSVDAALTAAQPDSSKRTNLIAHGFRFAVKKMIFFESVVEALATKEFAAGQGSTQVKIERAFKSIEVQARTVRNQELLQAEYAVQLQQKREAIATAEKEAAAERAADIAARRAKRAGRSKKPKS